MQKKYLKIFTYISLFSFLITSHIALAASLYIKPSAITVNEGDTFTASVDVDTEGRSVNVVEAEILYPQNLLSVVSVKSGTTFSINTPGAPKKSAGQVFFSAGASSGYTGKAVIGVITFSAKKAGNVELKITNGSTLLNDGNATEGLSSTASLKITILKTVEKTVNPPVQQVEIPTSAPIVTPESVVIPVPEVTPAPIVSPAPVLPLEAGITIPISDILNFVYILLGCIVLLILAVVMLVVTLTIKTHKHNLPNERKKV